MNKKKAIEILREEQIQYENSIAEAKLGDVYANECNENLKETVEALEMAIKALSK